MNIGCLKGRSALPVLRQATALPSHAEECVLQLMSAGNLRELLSHAEKKIGHMDLSILPAMQILPLAHMMLQGQRPSARTPKH